MLKPPSEVTTHLLRAREPTAQELHRFIEAFEALEGFEVTQRTVRGYGAFDPATLPMPEVQVTMAWLREFADRAIELSLQQQEPLPNKTAERPLNA